MFRQRNDNIIIRMRKTVGNSKQKKIYLDIIRVIAIAMVFNFHYTVIMGNSGVLFGFKNGDWGCVGTTLFFLISGNCLARNYGEKTNWLTFYKKRWMAIFPAFYFTYLVVFAFYYLIMHNNVAAGPEKWRIIFTFLGIDNYLSFAGVRNFALVGEWYTAVILFVYLIFPVLHFLYRKSKIAGTILILTLYVLNLIFTWGVYPDDAHLITGVTMFWIGMLTCHFEKKLESLPKYAAAVPLALTLILAFVSLPEPMLLKKNLMAVFLFLFFMQLGRLLEGKQEPRLLTLFCKIEYAIYLCHHSVLYIVAAFYLKFVPQMNGVIYYVVSFVGTVAFAAVITYVTSWGMKIVSKIGKRQ